MPPKRKAPGDPAPAPAPAAPAPAPAAPAPAPAAPALPASAVVASVSCALCIEIYEVPVAAPGCGHTFCRSCVQDCCAAGDASAALCPLCRAPLVAKPWPALHEPFTSRQATAVAGWHESVAVRGVCDLVRAALPPMSSSAAASAALRYLRGARYGVDQGRVVGLFSRIDDADMAMADTHGRNLLWWAWYAAVDCTCLISYRAHMFVKDKSGVTPIAVAMTACNTVTDKVWIPDWFVCRLEEHTPGLKTLPIEKLKEAGVVDIFLRVLRSMPDGNAGRRFIHLLEAAPALVKLAEFKSEEDEIVRHIGEYLVRKATDAASKIA